jgi:Domain of unknown function (DUF4440)
VIRVTEVLGVLAVVRGQASLSAMKFVLLSCLVLLATLPIHAADAGAPAAPVVIRELLLDFLTHNGDPDRHDRFWADDLVYTSAAGIVRTKAVIMKSVQENAAKPKPAEAESTYSADDINIRPYDGFAALTFRLVVHNPDGAIDYYRNSGTFIFRNGRWQVITWQATKVPPVANK